MSTITSFIMRDNSGSSEALTRAQRAQRRVKGKNDLVMYASRNFSFCQNRPFVCPYVRLFMLGDVF